MCMDYTYCGDSAKNAFSGPSATARNVLTTNITKHRWWFLLVRSCCDGAEPTGYGGFECASRVWAQQHPMIINHHTQTQISKDCGDSPRIIASQAHHTQYYLYAHCTAKGGKIHVLGAILITIHMYIWVIYIYIYYMRLRIKREKNDNPSRKAHKHYNKRDGGRDVGGWAFSFASAAWCCSVVRPSRHFNTQRRRRRPDTQQNIYTLCARLASESPSSSFLLRRNLFCGATAC